MASNEDCVPFSLTGDKEQDRKLLQPLTYILKVSNGHVWAKLTPVFNYWLKVPADKLRAIEAIIEIEHNSTLLLDDIEDNSTLREGIPVAHSVFGIPSTINAACYGLFTAFEKVIALNNPKGHEVFLKELLDLHRGQGIDMYWRDNQICPSEEEYKLMAVRKLGCLFGLDIRLKQLFSTCKKDFTNLINLLGLYFQIRDDYCSLRMQEYFNSKSYCEDLTEGKFSFPVIHAIWSKPEDRTVMNILFQRTKDIELKKHCVAILEKLGSFAYTRTVLEDLDEKIRNEVEQLGGNPLLIKVMDSFLDWKEC